MTTYRLGTTCVAEGCRQLPDVDLEGVGPLCHAHRSARMRADAARALRLADQGECPPSAMAHTPIGEGGQTRRSRACGRVALLRSRADSRRGALARLFCKSRQCPDCGPRRARRLHDQFLELLSAWMCANPFAALHATEIAPRAWASLGRNLRRHDAAYVRIPLTNGGDLVITAAMRGGTDQIETQADLEQALEQAFTWSPSNTFDKRRPSHRGFEPASAKSEAADEKPQATAATAAGSSAKTDPGGWELLAFAGKGVTLEMAVRAADQLDLEPEPMPESQLAHDWAEAFTLRLPAEGSPELEVLRRRLRLRSPGEADSVSRRSRLAA